MDLNHIPDAAMTAAVLALFADGPSTHPQHRSWRVKETDRIAAMATELRKLGAHGGGGRGLPEDHAAGEAQCRRRHRHLRRPPHGDVLLARRARRRAGAHQRPGVRGEDLSRRFSSSWTTHPVVSAAGHRHRRPLGLRQGHGREAAWPQALGFHYLESGALYRLVALAALRQRPGATSRRSPGCRRAWTCVFEEDEILLEDQDVSATDPARGRSATGPPRSPRMPAVRAGAARAPAGLPAAARAWWPTGATWAPWCSRTRCSKSS